MLGGSKWERAAVLAPVAVALALACWSLGFGLPYLFRPDEEVLVGRAVRMVAEHTANPLFFYYPPLTFQVFAAAEWLVSILGGDNLRGAAGPDPTVAYMAARAVSAGSLAVTAGFTFLTARRHHGTAAGLVAGLAIAIAPLAVRQAHFATTDAMEVALVSATMWAGVRAGGPRGFALAGVLAGLGAATKYHYGGLSIVIPLVLALWSGRRAASIAAVLLGAGLAFFLSFAATGLGPAPWIEGLGYVTRRVTSDFGQSIGLVYHPTVSLPYGLGLGTYALSLIGIVAAVRARSRPDVALLVYLAVFLAVVGASHQVFFRYVEPMYPALCVLGAGAVRLFPATVPRWAWGVALLLLLPSAYASVQNDRLLGATDTRREAADWLLAHAAPGDSMWNDNYWGLPLYDRGRILARMSDSVYHQPDPLAGSFLPGRYTDRLVVTPDHPRWLVLESGPPWQSPIPTPTGGVVVASFPAYSGAAPHAAYDPLDADWLPYWGFGSIDRPGPSVVIVRMG